MAQALFDQHPLEQYLSNAGEVQDLFPGTTPELEYELDPLRDLDPEGDETTNSMESYPTVVVNAIEAIASVVSSLRPPTTPSPFVERFKYHVISSSLLAVALSSPHSRTPKSSIPGRLDHSRTPSPEPRQTSTTTPDYPYLIPSLSLLFAAVLIHAGQIFLALASFGATAYTLIPTNETSTHDMTSSLDSLNELVDASDTWESVVQEAVDFLENDESSSTSPTSSIRAALHSTLLTTQTQCDNVRQLFSALTSPAELSQLSEMYAPPSPMAQSFSHERITRPLSLPVRRRTLSMPIDPFQTIKSKRQTWSGPRQEQQQQPGSPTNSLFNKRRSKRRSDLSSLFQSKDNPILKAISAPVTPLPPPLPFVIEEMGSDIDDREDPDSANSTVHFGAAALQLRREQKSAGTGMFKSTSTSSPGHSAAPSTSHYSPPRTPPPPFTTVSPSGTRFTPIQPTRHPLSLSALNFALQSALASKRYASSHLLALRFVDEEDDEGYWEDVRSVMGLLTSTLVDASGRLSEALMEVEQQRLRDQNPTPCLDLDTSLDDDEDLDLSAEDLSPRFKTIRRRQRQRQRPASITSFAPTPGNLSRFATHVEAILSALDGAKDNLDQCVASLRDEVDLGSDSDQPRKRQQQRRPTSHYGSPATATTTTASPALEAYERMRRELGMALRECERGRERLLEAVFPPPDPHDMEGDEEEWGEDSLPALGHDGSEDSDKPDQLIPSDDDEVEHHHHHHHHLDPVVAAVDETSLDDATSHLLIAASAKHLPDPGIEQVFEAESDNGAKFTRERSKLTREERIKMAKAQRDESASGGGLGPQNDRPCGKVEKWGPGGEVVQELMDVIWKVGERRRRMAESVSHIDKIHPV